MRQLAASTSVDMTWSPVSKMMQHRTPGTVSVSRFPSKPGRSCVFHLPDKNPGSIQANEFPNLGKSKVPTHYSNKVWMALKNRLSAGVMCY